MAVIYLILFLFIIPVILVIIDFIKFLFTGKWLFSGIFKKILEIITVIGLPSFFLFAIDESTNDCCSDSAVFSPVHKPTIYLLIILGMLFFLYSAFKNKIHSPVFEVLTNVFLVIGIVLNIFIGIQLDLFYSLVGNLPIILLFINQLVKNQRLFIEQHNSGSNPQKNSIEKIAWKILGLKPLIKFPFLLILSLPVLIIIICFLLLFGQKPDSIIRAFTDTYKHGFSQLDYLCDNVNCGGHYLCSVAANGHKEVVSPVRYGERKGEKIICNRQLLISNAFEELIEEKFPRTHKLIRHNYNKVGSLIHRHYHFFNHKIVSDIVYILMKPLEWFFLIILYTFDQKPENRIAMQYLSCSDQNQIKSELKN